MLVMVCQYCIKYNCRTQFGITASIFLVFFSSFFFRANYHYYMYVQRFCQFHRFSITVMQFHIIFLFLFYLANGDIYCFFSSLYCSDSQQIKVSSIFWPISRYVCVLCVRESKFLAQINENCRRAVINLIIPLKIKTRKSLPDFLGCCCTKEILNLRLLDFPNLNYDV